MTPPRNKEDGSAAPGPLPYGQAPRKSKIVCECLQVTEAQLLKAVQSRKLRTLKDVARCTSAGEGCNACHPLIKEYLERERLKEVICPSPRRPAARTDTAPALSP